MPRPNDRHALRKRWQSHEPQTRLIPHNRRGGPHVRPWLRAAGPSNYSLVQKYKYWSFIPHNRRGGPHFRSGVRSTGPSNYFLVQKYKYWSFIPHNRRGGPHFRPGVRAAGPSNYLLVQKVQILQYAETAEHRSPLLVQKYKYCFTSTKVRNMTQKPQITKELENTRPDRQTVYSVYWLYW